MSAVEQATSGEKHTKTTIAKVNQTTAKAPTKVTTTTTILKPYTKYNQEQQQHSSPRHQRYNCEKQQQQQQHPNQNHHQHQYHQYPEKSAITTTTKTTTFAASINDGSVLASTSTSTRKRLGRPCLSQLLSILFSTPGLVVLVILYSIMGGLLFPLLEAPQDITKSLAIAKSREDCLRELWIITEKLNVLYERNWTMLVHEQLRRFEGSIVAATRYGGLGLVDDDGQDDGNVIAGRFGGQLDALLEARWTFSEALVYSVTVITTIGHGSLTPKTSAGKIATILYALIGVPLMLMCLSSLGALLADALQCTYARICCRMTRSGRGAADKHHRISRCDSKECEEAGGGGRVSDVGRGSETEDSTNDRETHLSKYEVDCNSCKYDAVMSETNPNKGYSNKYHVHGASMVRGKERDSCQLLQNSSVSVNHPSPCMQLKSTTKASNGQFYQQLSNNPYVQQNTFQQADDAMQSNAVCSNSNASPPSKSSSPTTYCNSRSPNPTPAPQLLHHPLQQNYQHSTSAINSSPTTQSYVHMQGQSQQQAAPNPHLHHPYTHPAPPPSAHFYQPQQQQHFVAVPSNILRMQPAGAFYRTCSSVALPGSATIYFPISAASTAAATTTATATEPPVSNGSQVLRYNQPFVKYHTIQLQPKKPVQTPPLPPPPSYVDVDAAEISTTSNQGLITFSQDAVTETDTTAATAATCDTFPLPPPPPAYQTATVHGIRRAKFSTKPIAHGISTLLTETQISCSPDTSRNGNTSTSEGQPTTTTITPTTAVTSVHPLSTSSNGTEGETKTTTIVNSLHPTRNGSTIIETSAGMMTLASTNMSESNTAVDIMEDEEESEQQRIGNCPHGTPSRVPLISTDRRDLLAVEGSKYKEGGSGKTAAMLSRGLMNSTAASFHRHTLNTFQRGGGSGSATRKGAFFHSRRGNCSVHRSSRRDVAGGGCYGDTTETSDDDDYLPHGSTEYDLNCDEELQDDDDDLEYDGVCKRPRGSDSAPQVPITIVLLILVCYICLGTVIFALWENWSLIDGAYFCFVTLATIGYGDFLPERTFNGPEVQLFACCAYLLLGLVLVAMSFSILETQLMWKCKRIAVRLKLAKD